MQNALTRKLESFETLSDLDRSALDTLVDKVRKVGPRVDLIREGDEPESVHLILDGYACRYKVLPDGQREIVAYFVPGDFCDLNVFILDRMDHSIGTITKCQVVDIPRTSIDKITASHPRITRAFWWCGLVDEAVLREWLVNIGARESTERIAHLICELLMRHDAVGLASDNSYAFPFTQGDIADTMGLSVVHVNRVLRELRRMELITIRRRVLTVLDIDGLKAFCRFNPSYLHLENRRWADLRCAARHDRAMQG
ncbi:Crp/Fnr family transcriptional regulator [Methylobacterium sp. BTF04]|nr:Crp/Fnr family transcriptional regulator [Methylobacterium sp. BTF04]